MGFEPMWMLQTEKRNGWLLNKIANPESIADHMYRMAILSMLLDADGSQGIDKTKCVKLALLHDVAECIVGDITPKCGVPADVKKNKELKAMGGMMKMLEPKLADEIWELYESVQEYEDQKSVEAQVVKDLDRFEMLLTAYEYEKTYEKPLQDFFDTTNGRFFILTLRESHYFTFNIKGFP
ncbi:HDDC2 [Cordylochernes scorpioides]|uniref:5'-deoxynucleotidase HDDC2 n=1 Tax=Cordylochernes scorpioides TaxID=51811 RepID=A0ABY6LJ59_9ARAC|nr:HDDC2 [Cordylochernes scorpioides]